MPVKSLIRPARAFLYRPFTSRLSQTDMGLSQYISIKSPCSTMPRTRSRSARNGEIKAVSTITPASIKSLAISPMRRIFSTRSCGENPRSPHNPWRTLSPSSTKVWQPRWYSASSTAWAKVDLPAPDKPVNQMMAPRYSFCFSRRARVTVAWCQTVLLDAGGVFS